MIRRIPLPLVGPSAVMDSLPISAQFTENMYPESNPDTVTGESRLAIALRHGPGARQAVELAGEGRCIGVANGNLYAVVGGSAYLIASDETSTYLGAIPGSGRCGGTDDGGAFIVANGVELYRLTTTVAQVTDADVNQTPQFPQFLDSYVLVLEQGTGRFWYSAISDPTAWGGLDFATAESAPDDTLRILVDHREVWLFGERSVEIWYNDGSTPFIRNPSGVIEKGIASPWSAAKVDNTVFWHGTDGIVYRADGIRPVRISTHAVETALSGVSTAEGFTYVQDGHTFYGLRIPGVQTLMFDVSTGLWSTFATDGGEWRIIDVVQAYGKLYGLANEGGVYELSREVYTDGGDTIRKRRTTAPIDFGSRRFVVHRVGLEMDPGRGGGYVEIETSGDRGVTFNNPVSANIGDTGDYARKVEWHGLGSFRDLVLRFTSTSSTPMNWRGLWADIEVFHR